MRIFQVLFVVILLLKCNTCFDYKKPNIIIIIADDMGFNDIGFRGSNQIPTPNIDALAYNGIILNRHYVYPVCTPTRAALLTGKYAIHTGMQDRVIEVNEPWGLSLDEKILPEYLQEAGYKTHLVGKWHLGLYRKLYTPTMRGYHSHFGSLGPTQHYLDHTYETRDLIIGYDMRNDLEVNWNADGKYTTTILTDAAIGIIDSHNQSKPLFLQLAHSAPHAGSFNYPLAIPVEELRQFYYIKDKTRRKMAATISLLDKSIGKVIKALKKKKMLDNSIILFFSDNGGPSIGFGNTNSSNFPFRGQKYTLFEGGCRGLSAIWSPLLKNQQYISNEFIHVTDWFPTILGLLNITHNKPIDGLNVWDTLSNKHKGPRKELFLNFDSRVPNAALIKDGYKILNDTDEYESWYGQIDPKEQHQFSHIYNWTILQSNTNVALRSVMENNPPLTSKKIHELRKAATISCPSRALKDIECNVGQEACMFNILKDPCERNNIASLEPEKFEELKELLVDYIKNGLLPRNKPIDKRSNPTEFNNTWTWWYDELGVIDH